MTQKTITNPQEFQLTVFEQAKHGDLYGGYGSPSNEVIIPLGQTIDKFTYKQYWTQTINFLYDFHLTVQLIGEDDTVLYSKTSGNSGATKYPNVVINLNDFEFIKEVKIIGRNKSDTGSAGLFTGVEGKTVKMIYNYKVIPTVIVPPVVIEPEIIQPEIIENKMEDIVKDFFIDDSNNYRKLMKTILVQPALTKKQCIELLTMVTTKINLFTK